MPTVPLTIGQIATPHVLGYMMTWGLFGALVVQVYIYYLAFPNDRVWIKCLVAVLAVIETLQIVFMSHDAVLALGLGFGNPSALDSAHFAWITIPLITSLVGTVVQCFFAWRIYMLSKIWAISILIVLISLFQCSAGVSQAIFALQIDKISLVTQIERTGLTAAMWLSGAAVCDVLIAGCMTWTLSRSRKQNGSRQIDAVLTRLIRLTIETGSATAAMAVLTAVTYLTFKQDDFFITPSYILAELYTNNLLMIFNSRLYIENGRMGRPPDDPSFVSFRLPSTITAPNIENNHTSNSTLDENSLPLALGSTKAIEASPSV